MPSTLLLLPPAPHPPTYAALKAAYHAPLAPLLRSLATPPPPAAASAPRPTLDIALPLPLLATRRGAPRAALFAPTQKALAALYRLVASIGAKERLCVEGDEGLDVRVVLLAMGRGGEDEGQEYGSAVVGLEGLARCAARWDDVVGVEGEEGERVLRAFLSRVRGGDVSVRRVKGGIVSVDAKAEEQFGREGFEDVPKHFWVANGGTFDHLHIGHKLLLTMTVFMIDEGDESQQRNVTIGITAEDLLKNKKYADFLESWDERQKSVHKFIRGIMCFEEPEKDREEIIEHRDPGPNGHILQIRLPSNISLLYTEIWDPFGPTITKEEISALVISEETRKGGKAVNDKRKDVGFKSLEVFEVDVLDAEDEDRDIKLPEGAEKQFLGKLSSTELRKARSERVGSKSKT